MALFNDFFVGLCNFLISSARRENLYLSFPMVFHTYIGDLFLLSLPLLLCIGAIQDTQMGPLRNVASTSRIRDGMIHQSAKHH